ncbi:unnamed protein product [Didymodactylos carnosus]|uniref:Peptidylamidoglycolate lyase n=1 Tax=Didymodactylos carnosus TaxID=1234261 RepID=A0A8S2EY16_9BILA|nr:unnamed protein product [Didymodactylos carnosus]CAF4107968.1 unnamed protein product [Didymodactylos carnosus]
MCSHFLLGSLFWTSSIVSNSNADQLSQPTGLYVDSHGAVYVADGAKDDVLKFKAGRKTGVLVAGETDYYGDDANHLNYPAGLFVDEIDKNYLYICDGNNNRIQRWSSDGSTATTVAGSSSAYHSSALNSFYNPRSVIIDPTGKQMYISDASNNRIVRWPLKNGKQGQVVLQPTGVHALNSPHGIKVDADNNLHL